MEQLLEKHYDLHPLSWEKSRVGAGSDTFFVTCREGKYVVKYPAVSHINHPEAEPELCEYLLRQGIPACRFLKNRDGGYLTRDASGRQFHVQRFFDGRMYELNAAPEWLMTASGELLGKIHTALRDYTGLPEGIGKGFFRHMTPENALRSYRRSLETAQSRGDGDIVSDLQYRIGLMERFPEYRFDPDKLTCRATHGDYFLSQLLCGEDRIQAVIDWTTACVHPAVWEIVRSFVYGAPSCREGQIHETEFLSYVASYRREAELSRYDLENMIPLFYYQIAVCDYYGQYYASTADNRGIYLHQAVFSTKLLKWLEENGSLLTRRLLEENRI